MDEVTQELVLEWIARSGEARHVRVPRPTRVDPIIETQTEWLPSGLVRYTYTVTNGPRARQNILQFAIGVERPDLISSPETPPTWTCIGASGAAMERGYPARFIWAWIHPSVPVEPGRRSGPFRFAAAFLPGLDRAYLRGLLRENEGSMDPDRWGVSPWLRQQLEKAQWFVNQTVQRPAVSPKIPMPPAGATGEFAAAIADEMLEASRLPEFQDQRQALVKLADQVRGSQAAAAPLHSDIRMMGTSPGQKSFFRAMAFNLEYLGRMR